MSDNSDPVCERHGVDELPSHLDGCPYCKMERDREAEMVERATRRAPRSVDDPAPIGSYRAW